MACLINVLTKAIDCFISDININSNILIRCLKKHRDLKKIKVHLKNSNLF